MKWKNFKESKLVQAMFYKTAIPQEKIRTEWALRPMKVLPNPGMFRRYSEITWGMTLAATIGSMLLSAQLMWSINFPYFELPTAINTVFNEQELNIDSSLETHVPAWINMLFFEISWPLHSKMTTTQLYERYPDVMGYKYYMTMMSEAGLAYLIWIRLLLISVATVLAGTIAYCNSKRFLFRTEFILESEGAKVYEGLQAERELAKFWVPAYSTFDRKYSYFANMGENIYHPEDQRRQHTFIVGNSGSGKSQVLQEFIYASISAGLKTVILDPKSEWTKALFNEKDPTIALIDPLDSRSHVWSFMEDMKGIGFITSFVASVIPSGNSKDPMWTNAARMVNVALFLFLKKNFGDNATFKDVADVVQLTDEQIGYIVNKYYPHAARLVGTFTDEGLEQNQTVSGIMINMISFMEYFIDLARYWNKPSEKTISLYKFMTDPNYPIKTIIIRPNETEARMARGLTANMLAYMMNFIKKPEICQDKKIPIGNFILDEFQSPGKLEDENNDPVLNTVIQQGRSLGWGVYFATQTIPEAERIYGKDVIAGWRGTIGTQILAGAPTDSLQPWIDGFGDKKIQKLHLSQSTATNGDVSYSQNWQEHISKVMLPTSIASKLRNESPWIKFLIIPVGAENLFFLKKLYKDIPNIYPTFVRAVEGDSTLNPQSRVLKLAKQITNGNEPSPVEFEKPKQSVLDRFNELDQEYEGMDGMEYFVDSGKYADDEHEETEIIQNIKLVKKYDANPIKDYDELVDDHVVKYTAIEQLFGSPAINALVNSSDLLSDIKNKNAITTSYLEKVKFENIKRYENNKIDT